MPTWDKVECCLRAIAVGMLVAILLVSFEYLCGVPRQYWNYINFPTAFLLGFFGSRYDIF